MWVDSPLAFLGGGPGSLLAAALGSLLFGLCLAWAAVWVARREDPSRVLSRKCFHVGVFTGAVPAQLFLGFWGVVVYGTAIAFLVLVAVALGERMPLQRALARPQDGRDGARDLLLPLASTALGGLVGALLVGSFAVVGYLVCGWGDGAGEPVGRRFGRHRYSSPFSFGRPATRSLEGSAAVFLMGALGGWAALSLLDFGIVAGVGVGALCGFSGALAEGLSTHGTDNCWTQIAPSLLAWWILG